MRYIPILFSTQMVQAILEGRKTVTRRTKGLNIVNDCPDDWNEIFLDKEDKWQAECEGDEGYHLMEIKCPYAEGDILWVRETFAELSYGNCKMFYGYKADNGHNEGRRWKPSLFMPKEACRIFLEVTDVKVERLQDITEADAKSEGVQVAECCHAYYHGFSLLWQKINGKESWEANPWVWVISFKKIDKPAGFQG